MESRFTLLMVLHAHQPVGNFDHVFAHGVERCYRPMLEILARYPGFRCGLHFSGPLLSWLEANDAALLDQVGELCARGQVEILSGGYYEPLLASIPQADALAQLEMATSYTRNRFCQDPSGFWLAERIWEPGLPVKLGASGMAYTLVDDTHLYYAGLGPEAMYGYHLTEREGHTLALFPTHKELRYAIPFKAPQETLDFLRHSHQELGPQCATYGDDAEKFGLWPETYEWVIAKGWLERFIQAVLSQEEWLATSTPGRYLEDNPPRGRVYLPTASYEEMLTWALPADSSLALERLIKSLEEEGRLEDMRQFLRGGLWDNFLVKYRESNLMHKRMLHLSGRLNRHGGPAAALDHLYQAQCNCAYWHGLFGGLYLGHLRSAVHEHLIRAETLLDRELHGNGGWASCQVKDLDLDGHDEVILAGPDLDLVIHPAAGGSVSILDLRGPAFNLAGALTRRKEAYHAHLEDQPREGSSDKEPKSIHDLVVFKEEGLEDYLIYDWYERALFQDHILAPDTSLAALAAADYREWGDFINQPYELVESEQQAGRSWCRLCREGHIWAPGGPWPLRVAKGFSLEGDKLEAIYDLRPGGEKPPHSRFGVELNFSLLSASDPGKRLDLSGGGSLYLDSPQEAGPAGKLILVDEAQGFQVILRADPPSLVWCFPVETVSQSESGLERTYQGTSLNLLWDLGAEPLQIRLSLSLK